MPGSVAGGYYNAFNYLDAGYNQNSAWTGLGLAGSSSFAVAWGINNANPFQMVGVQYGGIFNGPAFAFLYQNGSLSWLTGLPGGGNTYAYKINDYGQIVGAADINNQTHACLWYNGLPPTDLGTLPGGNFSVAEDINLYGYTVGYSYDANGNYHAVIWDTTGIHELGILPGGTNSACYGVQPGESYSFAVGEADTLVNGNLEEHACVFDTGPVDLGTLGGSASSAYAVNDYFQIVGNAQRSDSTDAAFVYSYYGDTMYDLNTLISAASGWELTNAYAINDHGQIAGLGTLNGSSHAFLLTPTFHLKSIKVKPTTVPGSMTVTGTVTLNVPAPTDLLVYLGSSSGQIAFPAYCIIPEGETSQSFFVDTTPVTSTDVVQIYAELNTATVSTNLTIRPIGVKSLSISPSSVVGGSSATGKITLEFPAAPGPITVNLSSSNGAVAAPTVGSVVVPHLSSTAKFTIATHAVAANTAVTITATANGISKSANITVTP